MGLSNNSAEPVGKRAKFRAMKSTVIFIALMLCMTSALLSSCVKQETKPQNFNANFTVNLKDPFMRELAAATEKFHVEASGDLNPGSYSINNIPVNVAPGTKFAFEFALPVEPGGVVSTGHATGKLTTSLPLQVFGISTPQLVALQNGKASAEVNILRAFGNFFCNLLQDQLQTQRTDDVRRMFKSVLISGATLEFKPGSTLHMDKHSFQLDKNSTINLIDLQLNSNLDYTGRCVVDVKFAGNSIYQGKKVDTSFQSGAAKIYFDARRKDGVLTLVAKPNQKVLLNDCVFSFGRGKDSTMKCGASAITIKTLEWSKPEEKPRSTMHLLASSLLEKAHLDYNGKKFGLDAIFNKPVPVDLTIDRKDEGDMVEFTTNKGVVADSADLEIDRKTTKISMLLTNVHLGPIVLTKAGQFDFSLEKGTSGVKSFDWQNGKKSFSIKTAGLSELSVTPGMSLVLSTADGATSGSLPLNIKLGSAMLKSQTGYIDLKNVRGNITIDIQSEVELSSNLDFTIAQSSFLGSHTANVTARGLSLLTKNGVTTAELSNCAIVIPQKEIQDVASKQTPEQKTFDVNYKVVDKQRWRYKNLVVTKVIVTDPVIENIKSTKGDQFTFSTHGNLEVQGTVEKAGLVSVVLKHGKFENKPWTAKASAKGTGTLTYKVLPNTSLADSKVHYDLTMALPLPDDVDLDWREVSEGIVRKTEETIITSILKHIKPFKGTRVMPLSYSGEVALFGDKKQGILKTITVDKLVTKPVDSGIQVNFVAHAKL